MRNVRLGVSFSTKYCRELEVDPDAVLKAALTELGIRQFRLMSYWDECEPAPGEYDFDALDRQFAILNQYGAHASLSIGLRQPRYPECHQPGWAHDLESNEFRERLFTFITQVVNRYKSNPSLESYQLENEALNRGIGTCSDYDRARIKHEYALVKRLDSTHPIIMSTSNSWGLPLFGPIPDIVGFSLYKRQVRGGRVSNSKLPSWFHGWRAAFITALFNRPVVVHELQAEPWGVRPTRELSQEEQDYLMDGTAIKDHVIYAITAGFTHIDLWGLEWWYWRRDFGDAQLWQSVQRLFENYRGA